MATITNGSKILVNSVADAYGLDREVFSRRILGVIDEYDTPARWNSDSLQMYFIFLFKIWHIRVIRRMQSWEIGSLIFSDSLDNAVGRSVTINETH